MLFGSLIFVFAFLPLALLAYHGLRLRGRRSGARVSMIVSSLIFYGWWDYRYVPLVGGSVIANYALSRAIQAWPRRSRFVAALGIGGNLLLLGYYKYANFFVGLLDAATGAGISFPGVVLPLAISFFTFQQVAYLVECCRDRRAADNLVDYALFVLFFPHLIAGPITHHQEMLPQFAASGSGRLPRAYITVGSAIFTLGLAKKVLIADSLALFTDPIFAAVRGGATLSMAEGWLGALGYTLQLYFDFSGYSDMAIGLGLMFGILLPVNFASPYKATSIIEFWRRWHISLSRFLRNYVYIPLGGNRRGAVRRHANLMATMLLGGLWHGAGLTFVAWGFLHGAYLVIANLWRQRRGARATRLSRVGGWLLTSLAVVVAWVLFRADTFPAAWSMLSSMFLPGQSHAGGAVVAGRSLAWAAVAVGTVAVIALPNVLEMAGYPYATPGPAIEHDGIRRVRWPASSLVTAALLGAVAAFDIARLPDPGVFLYFTF